MLKEISVVKVSKKHQLFAKSNKRSYRSTNLNSTRILSFNHKVHHEQKYFKIRIKNSNHCIEKFMSFS